MAVMTPLAGLRVTAILFMTTACIGATFFVIDTYRLIATHPAGDRRFWDIAYIPFFVSLMIFGILRYRQSSSRMKDSHNRPVDSN